MKILVIGGTRFFGIHMVNALLEAGHDITIATRGRAADPFGERVQRIRLERTDAQSMKDALQGCFYDVIIDKIAYCSNDIRSLMEAAKFGKYIYMSSTAVYASKRMNTVESDFDGMGGELRWCDRADGSYSEVKRQAEYALWQQYGDKNWIAVRYPFVIGRDDYTNRLAFYVEHVIKGIPMYIDDLDAQMSFIRSDEAGEFMAFLVDKDLTGAVNGASGQTISIREILTYVESKTGTKAILNETGEPAPYNGEAPYSINTDAATGLGYRFSNLKDWIYELLDSYITDINMTKREEE